MADKKMPMCWKCASNITRPKGDNSLELIGCVEESKICNYSDAEKMCPLMNSHINKDRVIISIVKGLVEVDKLPDNIILELRDYDVGGDWDEENLACKIDNDGDRYQEMIFGEEPKEIDKNPDIEFHASGDQAFTDKKKDDEEENPEKYLNYYKCICGCEWQDHWSCMCDDRCPDCNTSIQCYKSDETETGETIEHFDPDED